jgi:hypothetical protein
MQYLAWVRTGVLPNTQQECQPLYCYFREKGAGEPSNRLGLYVHISKRLLYLYRFVPRSGLDNFPEYICLTGVFQDFPFGL